MPLTLLSRLAPVPLQRTRWPIAGATTRLLTFSFFSFFSLLFCSRSSSASQSLSEPASTSSASASSAEPSEPLSSPSAASFVSVRRRAPRSSAFGRSLTEARSGRTFCQNLGSSTSTSPEAPDAASRRRIEQRKTRCLTNSVLQSRHLHEITHECKPSYDTILKCSDG
eukprot:5086908-Pleurochrysis_carterae.AAC.3